jgi:mannose/cellobiose epimerase-like protein (N-acyl-D-glucosamine 2-epimerase family)
VSSCRFVYNYAMAYRHFGDTRHLDYARHGLRFLRDAHWDDALQGYDWELEWRDGRKQATLDATRHCYGLAFVLLAAAHATWRHRRSARADRIDLRARRAPLLGRRRRPLRRRRDAELARIVVPRPEREHAHDRSAARRVRGDRPSHVSGSRGKVASHITQRQAALSGGLVWEHFHADWSVDWDYNKEDSSNIFRPWGFQPGHQTEWAKLLLILERHRPLDWLVPRATELFDAALAHAWDADHGGLCYGFGPDFTICDHNKYFWVQAETFAAAAMLGAHRQRAFLGLVRRDLALLGALRRSPLRRVVPHPHLRQPQVQRREEPGRQDRLSHDGRVLRRARDPGARGAQRDDAMSGGTFPAFVSAGDILTDMVRAGDAQWTSVPGGAGWNVARAVARLGLPSALAGAIGEDCFSDVLARARPPASTCGSCSACRVRRCSRSCTRRARPHTSSSATRARTSRSIPRGCRRAGPST